MAPRTQNQFVATVGPLVPANLDRYIRSSNSCLTFSLLLPNTLFLRTKSTTVPLLAGIEGERVEYLGRRVLCNVMSG